MKDKKEIVEETIKILTTLLKNLESVVEGNETTLRLGINDFVKLNTSLKIVTLLFTSNIFGEE